MPKMLLLVHPETILMLTNSRIKYIPFSSCIDLPLQTERNFLVKSIALLIIRLIPSLLIEFARGGSRRRDE